MTKKANEQPAVLKSRYEKTKLLLERRITSLSDSTAAKNSRLVVSSHCLNSPLRFVLPSRCFVSLSRRFILLPRLVSSRCLVVSSRYLVVAPRRLVSSRCLLVSSCRLVSSRYLVVSSRLVVSSLPAVSLHSVVSCRFVV